MPLVNADRVRETTTTTGTGAYTLGGAVAGYRTFVSAIGAGNQCHYVCVGGTDWEIGIGTVSAGPPPTLTRSFVLRSSNADAPVNWGAGTKDIFCAPIISVGTDFPRVLFRDASTVTITNSTVETDILNYTVPAGVMSDNRAIRVTLLGARLNNSGAAEAAPTFRIYLAGTVQFADAAVALANGTTWAPVAMEFFIAKMGASAYLGGIVSAQGLQGGATTGIGDLAGATTNRCAQIIGSAAGAPFTLNTDVAWQLRVTWQNGTANANVTFRRHYALVELI